ncbi:ABC transporter substrate-binding protein [Microbacterium memoriense]|uniref:ABC transporter substrate-binding protein n=1 Tax=Microbacterium memoriense TaxID=2978350 RepID=A0ABT2PAR2_9MICO|nr:ABC transporter substrate-binding protein [Microbacterium memoriense]MCT9001252.1 ABC transporter substrate-binding protein [Microbacterium memoriense]
MRIARKSGYAAAGLVVVSALTLAGCSSSSPEPAVSSPSGDLEIGAVDLAAAGCPADIRIQTDWNPESEHGHLYELVGDDYTVDSDEKSVTGPLVTSGEYTGVDVTILSGGPATGFTQPNAQMYNDPSIFLAYVGTDEAIAHSGDLPTVGVFAPLQKDPQMLMWDPETYPDVEGIADLGAEGVTIRVFPGGTYIDAFVGQGILSADQIDSTYDGAPAVFVSEGGAIAQQGFASAEPYIYENEVEQWGKPVAYQLINDAGYPKYAAVLSVIPENIDTYSECLTALVPVLQQATVDFFADPQSTIDLVLELVEAYDTGWVYSQGVAEFSVETMLNDGIAGNDANGEMGTVDPERMTELFDLVTPIYTEQSLPVKEGVTVDDIWTDQFLDSSISF